MIDARTAMRIAEEVSGDPAAGIAAADGGYVVGFHRPDPYANLPMFIDAETGEWRTLGASEYVKMMDTLRPIELHE